MLPPKRYKSIHCRSFFLALYHRFSPVRGRVLTSSGSIPLPITVAGDRIVVLPTKSSANPTGPTNDWFIIGPFESQQKDIFSQRMVNDHGKLNEGETKRIFQRTL